ncbi:MAG: hypothetical protein V4648_00040 [Bacteroidota bacterium]
MIKYKYHFFLILIGLSVIAVLNGLIHFDAQNLIYPDSESYYEAAKNVYVYHIGHNYRPMIMAAINGIPYLFGCSDAFIYEFSYYVNLFCWLATALVLFEILRSFLSDKIAFLFALLSFFFIGTIVLIYHLLSENIYTLFIVLVFYFLLKYYKTKSFWSLSIALSLLTISMLVRPGSKWLAVLFLLFYSKELLRFYKTNAALLLYGSWLLVVIQCAGIKYQFGNFTISYIDSVTYYNYLGNKAVAYKNGAEFNMATDPRTHYIFSLQPSQIQEEAKRDLLHQLRTNSEGLLFAYCSDVYDNTISGSYPLTECRNIENTSYFPFWKNLLFIISQWQNRIFTILGILLATFYFFKSYKKETFFSLIAVYIGYIIGTSGISCSQGDRFHLVVFPFVLILLAKWFADRRKAV